MIRYPRPVVDGDVVGVVSPSAGVEAQHQARLAVALDRVRDLGFRVRAGSLLSGSGVASGSAQARADELMAMMTDPQVRAVVPPWGGEIAIDLLHRLDWDELAADPTWLVGYSDISTLLLPLILRTGVATLHGQNLMDTPYRVPAPMAAWHEVVRAASGSAITQGAAERYRASGFDDFAAMPNVDEYTLDTPGGWTRVDADGDVDVTGRLIGGCLETVSHLAGTPFGDVDRFVRDHAPEGLIVYLESAQSDAADVTRRLFGLRYAGWFTHARAVLIGRTRGGDLAGWSQHDAARHVLGDLGIPVLVDVDCGHVPPHLSLVNGALATVTHTSEESILRQELR
ncbi:LD-carboxypeptidase [Cellulomonas cellasea]|uniref:S66 family peptidase n=1 Tax=Cellulomonas cellasea TaxID=43670 RepID=UPI0025A46C97|nr:S66 peptidase family protein [Cellulomonas cellasea]MDM8084359.1 LD-carboxypeptidase [Cellulomonas cellasea]